MNTLPCFPFPNLLVFFFSRLSRRPLPHQALPLSAFIIDTSTEQSASEDAKEIVNTPASPGDPHPTYNRSGLSNMCLPLPKTTRANAISQSASAHAPGTCAENHFHVRMRLQTSAAICKHESINHGTREENRLKMSSRPLSRFHIFRRTPDLVT